MYGLVAILARSRCLSIPPPSAGLCFSHPPTPSVSPLALSHDFGNVDVTVVTGIPHGAFHVKCIPANVLSTCGLHWAGG